MAAKKTATEYGWVTARLTEANRDLVEAMRADSGMRSLSSTVEALITFVETGHRDAFLAHAAALRAVGARKPTAAKAEAEEPFHGDPKASHGAEVGFGRLPPKPVVASQLPGAESNFWDEVAS